MDFAQNFCLQFKWFLVLLILLPSRHFRGNNDLYRQRTLVSDVRYLAEVKKYYSRIYEEVKGCFIKDGGAIIGVQIENEYGHCGGLQVTKHRRTVPSGQDIGAMSLTKLASGCNLLGYYMYHGGTNPHGKLTTLQESTATGYLNDLPEYSYDFKAPLREYGQRAESFGEIKLLSMFVKDFGSELCTMPAYIPESTSSDPNNLSDLRMSVRHNGKKGYIAVCG